MMVKVLLLEQWYNLSDPQMEEALQDRISFRRFAGSSGRYARLFDDQPLSGDIGRAWDKRDPVQGAGGPTDERGLVLKEGTLMDPHCSRAAAVHGGRGPRVRPIPMRTGPRPTVGGGPTWLQGAWVWTPARDWCGRRRLPRPGPRWSGDERAVYGDRAYRRGVVVG